MTNLDTSEAYTAYLTLPVPPVNVCLFVIVYLKTPKNLSWT